MRAREIMTALVHTVGPDTKIADLARLLMDKRISAAPVVDDTGRLVGIVSESDLLRRREIGTDKRRSWLLRFVTDTQTLAAEYVKASAPTVGEIMSRQVVTVGEDMPVAAIADLLEARGLKRVPVVRDSKVVGIVSRANLVQALATHGAQRLDGGEASDQALRARLVEKIRTQPWSAGPTFNILVENHVAHFWGFVRSEDERKAMIVAAETLEGITGVEDHLTVPRWDYGV